MRRDSGHDTKDLSESTVLSTEMITFRVLSSPKLLQSLQEGCPHSYMAPDFNADYSMLFHRDQRGGEATYCIVSFFIFLSKQIHCPTGRNIKTKG